VLKVQTVWRALAGFGRWLTLRHQQEGEVVGKYYRRTGDCNRCSQCCQAIYLTFNRQVIETEEQFEAIKQAHPADYQSFEPIEHTETGILFKCNNLQWDGNCSVYLNRPSFCRTYPNEDMLLGGGKLPNECSYQFELLRPFAEVLSNAHPKG
jgi:Fe-S-cluster containining protein